MENNEGITVYSNDGSISSQDPYLVIFSKATKEKPIKVRCIKHRPSMVGFGKILTVGDIIEITGTTHSENAFRVSVPAECAFYDFSHFEPYEVEGNV